MGKACLEFKNLLNITMQQLLRRNQFSVWNNEDLLVIDSFPLYVLKKGEKPAKYIE